MKQPNKKILIIASMLFLISGNSFALPFFTGEKKVENDSVKQNDDASEKISEKISVDKVDPNDFAGTAVLQGLNKVTAKTSELKVKVGGEIEFGKLIIKAKKCWKSPPDQRPENKILLEISEIQNDGNKKPIFYGWMFSSSPSISGIEHPIYDITAIACK